MNSDFSALKKNIDAEGTHQTPTSKRNQQQQLTSNVKINVKTKFLLHDILNKLALGMYPSLIAERFGWRRQRIHYYISKLISLGLIQEKFRSSIKIYELTSECKNFITGCNQLLTFNIRLHNVSYSYPIVKNSTMPYDKEISVLGYWNKQIKRINNVTIEKTTQHIIIHVGSLIGSDPFELLNKARSMADEIRILLEKDLGFQLGDPVLSRKPHFAVQDPIANKIVNHVQISTDQAKLDASEGLGELEYFDPQAVDNYIKLPEKVAALEKHLIKQTHIMDQFSKNIELHLAVLSEIRDAVKKLGGNLDE
jgi:predicted transcriptional regulator